VNPISFDVADSAGGFAAKRDSRGSIANGNVPDHHVLRGAIHPQSIGVPAGLQYDRVIVAFDIGILYQHL